MSTKEKTMAPNPPTKSRLPNRRQRTTTTNSHIPTRTDPTIERVASYSP